MNDDQIIAWFHRCVLFGDPPEPAPRAAIAEVETVVGHPMPPLLKRLYLDVGDGGEEGCQAVLSLTQPEYCCGGLHAEPLQHEYRNLSKRLSALDDPSLDATTLVPLAGGCSDWTLVDYGTPNGIIWSCHFPDDQPAQVKCLDITLAEWLIGWRSQWNQQPVPLAKDRRVAVAAAFESTRTDSSLYSAEPPF